MDNGPAWDVAVAAPGRVAVVSRFTDSLWWVGGGPLLTLPTAPCAVAAGDAAVVAVSHFGRAATVIDGLSGAVRAEVPIPFLGTAAAVSGVGFAAGLLGVLTVFDLATGAVLHSAPLPGPACALAAGPEPCTAVVTGDGWAALVDHAGAVVARYDTPPGPVLPAVDPATGFVLLACHRPGLLVTLKPHMRFERHQNVDIGVWRVAVHPARRMLFLAGYLTGSVVALDADSLDVLARQPVPRPYNLAVDEGDGAVWVASPAVAEPVRLAFA